MSFFKNLNISGRLIEVIKRFPVEVFFAFATTFTLILILDTDNGKLFRWPVCGFIGFLAMLNWTVFKEAFRLSVKSYWTGVLLVLILLALYYYMMPNEFDQKQHCFWFFTVGLSIILHLLLSLIPFLKSKNNTAFTNYNISLFLSWMQSALYSIIFYLALSLAILALDKLFDIKLEYIVYFKLFILITGIIQSTYFLSEIPDNFYDTAIPAKRSIFKIVTSFVLIPITFIYGAILYAYFGRLVITDHVMVDWTFIMVFWYFAVGLLAWLFAGYYENEADNTLMAVYRKWFFRISIFPMALLYLSLYRNITQSGITTDFYLSAALASSFGCILIYMVIKSSGPDKRIVPMIFILFAILSFMGGPFSVCKLPVTNQQKHLIHQLTGIGIIQDNKIAIDTSRHYPDTNSLISNNLYYLESMDALGFITTYDTDHLIKTPADSLHAYELVQLFRLNRYKSDENHTYWDAYFTFEKTADLTGYDRMIPQKNEIGDFTGPDYFMIDTHGKGHLFLGNVEIGNISLKNDLYQLSLNPDSDPVLEFTIEHYKLKMIVESANGENKNGDIIVSTVKGLVFIGQK